MKEKKNADKSPNIIIIYLPGRRQISKIGKILQKKEKERERVHINNDTELGIVLTD